MMEPTEHEGVGHSGEWREGSNLDCADCKLELEHIRLAKRGDGPNFNLNWLRTSNTQGHTANELKQEIYESARKDGRDITRA